MEGGLSSVLTREFWCETNTCCQGNYNHVVFPETSPVVSCGHAALWVLVF